MDGGSDEGDAGLTTPFLEFEDAVEMEAGEGTEAASPNGCCRRGGKRSRGRRPAVTFQLDADSDGNSAGDGEIGTDTDSADSPQPSPAPSSLAGAATTPRCAALLVSALALTTHGLFLYGQIAPMWRLHVQADVDVWANATTYASRRTFAALGLDTHNHLVLDRDDDVQTFTYAFAVRRLWDAVGLPDRAVSRLAAVLLVLFSGVWPHLKLLLLHGTFLARTKPGRGFRSRTASLYWLGTFGKWTLADVFVVCALIGVVHLDWDVDPAAVRDGLAAELPVLVGVARSLYPSYAGACAALLRLPCEKPDSLVHRTKCLGCEAVVHEAYDHPDWARGAGRKVLNGVQTDGGGGVSLRVAGMEGIYPFCAAAILSLLLGVLIDVLDHRARRGAAADASRARGRGRDRGCRCGWLLGRSSPWWDDDDDDYAIGSSWCHSVAASIVYAALAGGSLLTALLVYRGTAVPTMEREVVGAIPRVMEDVLGIQWERPYSLSSLVRVSGAARGWDRMLMGTFALFVLVGPILRGGLCVATLVLPWAASCHELLLSAINMVGAFCAWEVFAIALYMVYDLIPSVTDTILRNPICAQLSPEDGSCLMIEFNLLGSFVGLLVGGGVLLVLLSTVTIRLGFAGLDVYGDGDAGGPYCCSKRDRREGEIYDLPITSYLMEEDDDDDLESETDVLL